MDPLMHIICAVPARRPTCSACVLAGLCLPVAVDVEHIDAIEAIVEPRRPLQRGDHLFRGGDAFASLYAVRSGCIKSYRLTANGEEQVVGFHMPGEIFGLDGIGEPNHVSSAVAITASSVCDIPFNSITALSKRLPGVQGHLLQLMSREIAHDQHILILLNKRTADERVATFLLSLAARFRRRKLSATRFELPMSRADIGNYLGLVIETVSRALTRLQRQKVIRIQHRDVEILDPEGLHAVAGVPLPQPPPDAGAGEG